MVFQHDGKAYYLADASECAKGNNLIALPDGTVLKVTMWFECSPPEPMEVEETYIEPGVMPHIASFAE